MAQRGSLLDAFRVGAGHGKSITVLGRGDHAASSTYTELLEEAEGGAAVLVDAGVEVGQRVAMSARTTLDFVLGCVSVWRAGAIVVPLPLAPRFLGQAVAADQIDARLRAARPDMMLADPADPASTVDVRRLDLAELREGDGQLSYEGPGPDDVAVVQFTSGSTSAPRGIQMAHSALIAQFEALRKRMGIDNPEKDVYFTWLPLYHDLGFVCSLLRTMAIGFPLFMLPTDLFLATPGRWLTGMSRTRATASAAPNFAFGLAARVMERGLKEPVDLSSIEVVANGGEANNPATMRRFLEVAEPLGFDPGALLPGYGCAESTCVITVPPLGYGSVTDYVDRDALAVGRAEPTSPDSPRSAGFVSVGIPLDGTEVRVVDEDGRILGEREVGEIQSRGDCLMIGYLDDPEATEAAFQDGWLRTGDLGYMVDGHLHITGRAKDMIIVRGQNYYAEDLEQVLMTVEGIRPGSCVAISVPENETEAVVIAAETKLKDPQLLEELRESILKKLYLAVGLAPKEILLLPPMSVPKTTSGKLQRSLARDLYLQGLAHQVALNPQT